MQYVCLIEEVRWGLRLDDRILQSIPHAPHWSVPLIMNII